jgi:hypothetical protein
MTRAGSQLVTGVHAALGLDAFSLPLARCFYAQLKQSERRL